MTTPTQSKIHPTATLGIMYQSHFLPFADMADFISLSLNTTSPKVLVIGAHPDDPETCCGGTIITMKNAGYDVVVVYMTRGQSGISGKSKVEKYDEMLELIIQENPDIVFTHCS